MLSTYRKALALLSCKEKRRGGLLLGMVIVMAVLETAGFTSVDSFILALGSAAFGLILFSAFFRSLTHYAMNRFVEMRRHSIAKRRMATCVGQALHLP